MPPQIPPVSPGPGARVFSPWSEAGKTQADKANARINMMPLFTIALHLTLHVSLFANLLDQADLGLKKINMLFF